ncbi:MAG: glycosyltransferase [Candidatus Parvarchaeota archaeon]|nr:glycosyltransferase [Candidatus Jingweiarchaeum tengchongense]
MKRIAIIAYYPGPLRVHPSLIQAAHLLSEHFFVDIFKCHNDLDTEVKNIFIDVIHFSKYQTNPFARIASLFKGLKVINKHIKKKGYISLICVDAYGLMLGGILKMFNNTPLIYYSLELLSSKTGHFSTRGNPLKKFLYISHNLVLKSMERYFHRQVYLTIIQDEIRWHMLKRLNKIRKQAEVVFVPNSRIVKEDTGSVKSRYLHNELGIPEDKIIVLYSGSIFEGIGIQHVIEESIKWPSNTVLVLHVRGNKNIIDTLIDKSAENSKNLYVLTKSYHEKEYYELLKSSSIGLVWYDDFVDPNYYYIGAASGKLFYYLECGLPVVARRLPGLAEILEYNKAGLCVDNARDIGTALKSIIENYDAYSQNAVLCHRKYDFRTHFKNVVDRLLLLKASYPRAK